MRAPLKRDRAHFVFHRCRHERRAKTETGGYGTSLELSVEFGKLRSHAVFAKSYLESRRWEGQSDKRAPCNHARQ